VKTPSPFLYDLVHKLSKSEKRYLKVQTNNREKDYLVLYDALLAQKHFDEPGLIAKHKGANFLKNLAVNKRYLYDLILKSLANFGEKTIDNQVFEKISATNILIDKGLYLAAYHELKKGKKLAKKFELFELQIKLLGIEKQILSTQFIKDNSKNQNQELIFEEEQHCLKQLMNTNEYWYLNQQISKFQMQYQKIQTSQHKKHMQAIVQSPKFSDPELASNIKSKIFYFQANSTYYFMLGDVEMAYQTNKQFLDFLESKPHFLKLYAERYLATLNNILIDSFGMDKQNILKQGIKRLDLTTQKKEFKGVKDLDSRVFRQKHLLLLNWSLRQKNYNKALELIPTIESGLEKYGNNIEKHHRITFYYLSAYILFINKRHEQALKWSNLILNEAKEDVVKEIFYFSRILNLLIHFELKNFILTDSLVLSIPKYLKARREIYNSERALFSFLRKLRNSVDKKEKKKLIDNFNEELKQLIELPKEKRMFNFLDLRIWLIHVDV
jgi:hypothetical protein